MFWNQVQQIHNKPMYRLVLIAVLVVCSTTAAKYEKPSEDVIAEITRNGETVCHAVLASPNWLVGLSDCVNEDRINKYKVVVGGTYERTITSKRMMDSRDSLALFSLSKKVKYEPAVIAKPDQLMKITFSQSMSKIIAEDVEIDVIASKKCQQKENYNRRKGQDLCYDSVNKKSYSVVAGSPILSYNFERWSLIGLTLESETSNKRALGLDLTKYRSWILEVLKEPIPCNPSEFRCSDGTCISNSKVCDDKMDCPRAGEDEHSCGCSALGKKFVFGYNNLFELEDDCDVLPSVYLTSTQPTLVQIYGPNITINCSVDGSKRVNFHPDVYPPTDFNVFSGTVSNYSIEVTSDNPITVVAVEACEKFDDNGITADRIDGTLVYPENCLSNEYVVDIYKGVGYANYGTSDIVVIGIESETNVTILTAGGDKVHAVIDRLDMLSVSVSAEIEGTTVTADKNVAVFTGNDELIIKINRFGKGASYEQTPPISSLGKIYIASIIAPSLYLFVRITGAYDNTTVKIGNEDGVFIELFRLDKGTVREFFLNLWLNGSLRSIVADKGILVTQYETTVTDYTRFGNPAAVVLPALTQCESEYFFTLPMYMSKHTIVVYISECYGTDGLRLNGSPVNQAIFKTIDIPGFGKYNVVIININPESQLRPVFTTLSHTENGAKMCAILRSSRYYDHLMWRIGGLM